ncbi:MAG: ABC transporter ATP-binding protein [Bacillota bacterium]
MKDNQNAVKVTGLKKKYPGIQALKGIDVSFPAGQITGLIGPNGSGKSTLLRSIAGLTRIDSGQLEVLGQTLSRKLKEKIAFLPEINHFYEDFRVGQLIRLTGSQFATFNSDKAREISKFMEINTETRIKELSRGMVGRVKLILTMARQVPLIIMDEPLAGIDPKSRARILESLISEYNAEQQTIILSTHEVLEAEKFFDYVVFLEQGEIALKGNADDLRQEHGQSIQDLCKEVLR